MRLATRPGANGTAVNVFSAFPVVVAGKTGTAEHNISNRFSHTAFGAFAPFDNPQIAIYVNVPYSSMNRALHQISAHIARDAIGAALGVGATMGELTRTRSGVFSIENSFTLEQIKTAAEKNILHEIILPVEQLLPYPIVFVKPESLARALNGNPLPNDLINSNEQKIWLCTPEKKLIGLFSLQNKEFRAEVML
jgi:hypothetical protein